MNIRIGADDAIILNGRECIADVDYDLCKIRLSSSKMGDGRQAVTKIKKGSGYRYDSRFSYT